MSLTKHTHTLLERLQHLNSGEPCQKTKVCGYRFDQQAWRWFYFFRVECFLDMLLFLRGRQLLSLFLDRWIYSKTWTKRLERELCATTRSNSGHHILAHWDGRSPQLTTQVHSHRAFLYCLALCQVTSQKVRMTLPFRRRIYTEIHWDQALQIIIGSLEIRYQSVEAIVPIRHNNIKNT